MSKDFQAPATKSAPDPLIDVLNDIEEFLEDQQDVRDGPDGEQLPNKAMSLLSALAQARTEWARAEYRRTASETRATIIDEALLASSPLILQAWADRCGIDVNDERVQEANKVGWPHDYGLFEAGWNALVRALKNAAPQVEDKTSPPQSAGMTPAVAASSAPSAERLKVRGAYIPHTEHEIEMIRACLDDGTYTAQERKDFGTLCDMAINALLYGQEIDRLRSSTASSGGVATSRDVPGKPVPASSNAMNNGPTAVEPKRRPVAPTSAAPQEGAGSMAGPAANGEPAVAADTPRTDALEVYGALMGGSNPRTGHLLHQGEMYWVPSKEARRLEAELRAASSAANAEGLAFDEAAWQSFRQANGYPDTERYRQGYTAALEEGDRFAAMIQAALPSAAPAARLTDWLRENAPDCGDNSCMFGGRGKGGMRTNGGCRCFQGLPSMRRIYAERMFEALSACSATERTPIAPSTTVDASDVQLLRDIAYSIGFLHNADIGHRIGAQGLLEREHGPKLGRLIQRIETDLKAAGDAEADSWGLGVGWH